MQEVQAKLRSLSEEVNQIYHRLKLPRIEKQLSDLRQRMIRSDFWQDSQGAQEISRQEAQLTKRLQPWQEIKKDLQELEELATMDDEAMQNEIEKQVNKISVAFEKLKKELRFQGPYDDHDVILRIYAGAGGTDAQDWAQMLQRMYIRWAEVEGLKVQTIDQSAGEEAGLKSATLLISGGTFLYAKLAGEHGVHRLVRLSPFNADNLRQTSFAKVEIMPKLDQPGELQIDDKELKIDVYRAGGHGGQSVNTTDSAVRVTHLPTGISVAIQNERSQLQNKETALSVLRSRLATLQLEQHVQTLQELKGPNQSAEWGNQIRSYVLHPYKQVKDLRTGYQTSDPDKVLNGDLNQFIDAWLEQNIEG